MVTLPAEEVSGDNVIRHVTSLSALLKDNDKLYMIDGVEARVSRSEDHMG